ncbi:DUF6777 domain-containing protein [Streptomyces sp. ODS05-4]|uniref:DUF6777 domain-containing protein n=1 Tax=Streptomyces sp. ODS05-4 TaxID=2944939 RepID=UPI002108B2CA|nr:DUF6777 domain-containing protein [Streptomyces sp. ODS05-4]
MLAAIAAVVVAAVALAVVLSRSGGGGGGGGEAGGREETISLQPAAATGPDPFTPSTAEAGATTAPPTTPAPSSPAPSGNGTVRQYEGSRPGLYGGTMNRSSCDVERQISYLTSEPPKNRAFAKALRIRPGDVPDYLRALSPLVLRADTWVTNHSYRDGEPRPYQAVLQAGTAVMVDDRGAPRVRCACGNPLGDPVVTGKAPRPVGTPWPGYSLSRTVVVKPAPKPVEKFVVLDTETGRWMTREAGDSNADRDGATTAPTTEPTDGTTAPPSSPDTGTAPPSSVPPQRPESPADPGTSQAPEPPPDTDTQGPGDGSEPPPPPGDTTGQPPPGNGSPEAPPSQEQEPPPASP